MTDYQLVFLCSKVNGCDYREPEIIIGKWDWPKSTWLSERLALVRGKEAEGEEIIAMLGK